VGAEAGFDWFDVWKLIAFENVDDVIMAIDDKFSMLLVF
jgi:hypothetical protein